MCEVGKSRPRRLASFLVFAERGQAVGAGVTDKVGELKEASFFGVEWLGWLVAAASRGVFLSRVPRVAGRLALGTEKDQGMSVCDRHLLSGALASPPATAKARSATSSTQGAVISRTSGEGIGRCAWSGVAGGDGGAPAARGHAAASPLPPRHGPPRIAVSFREGRPSGLSR